MILFEYYIKNNGVYINFRYIDVQGSIQFPDENYIRFSNVYDQTTQFRFTVEEEKYQGNILGRRWVVGDPSLAPRTEVNAAYTIRQGEFYTSSWAIESEFEKYSYFELLTLYKGVAHLEEKEEEIKEKIKELIEERNKVEVILAELEAELKSLDGDINSDEYKVLESEIAKTIKDIEDYEKAVGNYIINDETNEVEEPTSAVKPGKYTIWYELYKKYKSEYIANSNFSIRSKNIYEDYIKNF